MPANRVRIPKLRLHKPSGRAFVELSGRRTYLGPYGDAATDQAYQRAVNEWLANGRRPPDPEPREDLRVAELVDRYLLHCDEFYRHDDGRPTREHPQIELALRPLVELYGLTRVADFGPKSLKAVRQRMIERDWSRGYVNHQVGRIKRAFRWGVAEELVEPRVRDALEAVEGLRRGRCGARETPRVLPVPDAHVAAVEPRVSRQVWAVVQLQLATAARPCELLGLRPIDLQDTDARVWRVELSEHKTAHRGRRRVLWLGPRAQAVIAPFLAGRPVDAPLFSPAEAEAESRERRHAERTTPASCGNVRGSNRRRGRRRRRPGAVYTTDSYRRAIARACDAANVPRWAPYRLRHNAATTIRREFGLEAARILLGHSSAELTDAVYAERDERVALAVAEKLG